jgi:RimJ/RimL family protein N-acetyltransferase
MSNELSDGQIYLRPYRAEDINALYEAVIDSKPELAPWMPWCHADYSLADSAAFILSRDEARQKEDEYGLGIFEAGTNAYLGGIGLNQINRVNQYGNLGYWVRSNRTRRGIATSAARLAAHFGLTELNLQRLEIIAAVGNIASQRVAEKLGAQREGVLRKRLLYHGEMHDAVLYSLIAEDLKIAPSLNRAS